MNKTQHSVITDFINPIVLRGQIGFSIAGDRVVINVEEIANDREALNLSGSLNLELWALEQPYQSGGFSGHNLAAISLGEISGQHCLRNCQYDLNFQQPPAGTWNLVLMLREWEYGAYITRDFANFAVPYTVEAEQPAARPQVIRQEDNVIAVTFREAAREAVAEVAPQVVAEAQVVAERVVAEEVAEPVAKPTKEAAKAVAKKVAEPVAKPAKAKKPKAKPETVSVNSASVEELTSIKGVSQKLAQAIVDNRPYKTLGDLLAVKGMGKKVFDKLEDLISL